MEVHIVSSEMIKPSSPTPDHLRHYKLSFLDQLSLKSYNPFIYFYSLSNHADHISGIADKLKESLSRALTLYYPLAGRVISDRLLECNDDGALYVEARVATKLDVVLENPIPLELNKLLPMELDEVAGIPLGIQLNIFDCGGIAIGVCVSHQLGDALSDVMFIQLWMDIARGQNDAVVHPEFAAGDLFPFKDDLRQYNLPSAIQKNMCITNLTKRFVFQSSSLESLRKMYQEKNQSPGKRLSRVAALSAFIWTRFSLSKNLADLGLTSKEFSILHFVNIPAKCDPPLPSHSFGNYYTVSQTNGSVMRNINDDYAYELANNIGESLRKVDKGLVEHIRTNGDEFRDSLMTALSGDVVRFFFTSLCRFPLYKADFGFGKPAWVSSAARGFDHSIALFDNKTGDGIEAYICLKPEDMAKLEADAEFLAFATPKAEP